MIEITRPTSTDPTTEDSKEFISYSKLIINQIRGKYSNILGLDLIKHYHLVWNVLKETYKPDQKNDHQAFERYCRFFNSVSLNTKLFIQYFFPSVFILLVTIFFIDIYLNHAFHLLLILYLHVLFVALFVLRQLKLHQLQINETHFSEFLTFIHPVKNKSNFDFFKSIDLNDEDYLKMFHESFLGKSNPVDTQESVVKKLHNTTTKLLALDFFLYSSGGLDVLLSKHISHAKKDLTKDGIYVVLSKIFGTNETNIEQKIRYDLPKFHNAESPTREKIGQLKEVRDVFVQANLTMIVKDIDDAIEKMNTQLDKKKEVKKK